jgi:hypothetical protein
MTSLRFHLTITRFCVWLNTGNNALNLTAMWGLVALSAIILAIEYGA